MHRGPTHSFIVISLLTIPFFIAYRKQAIPYYVAALSHIFIGDFFTGGVQLFWPISQSGFGAVNIGVTSITDASIELLLLALSLPIMFKSGDLKSLLKPNGKNWILIIPLGAVLGALLAAVRGPEFSIQPLLIIPSIFFLFLFSYSIYIEFKIERKRNTMMTFSAKTEYKVSHVLKRKGEKTQQQ